MLLDEHVLGKSSGVQSFGSRRCTIVPRAVLKRSIRPFDAALYFVYLQTDALEAAVSNLLDHWEPLRSSYGALSRRLEEQAVRHEGMLQVSPRLFPSRVTLCCIRAIADILSGSQIPE